MGFDKDVFAARLRGKRAELGISQTALAEKIGISTDAVFKYESGLYTPGADKVFSLADALDCTPDYLMGWDDRRKVPA